MSDTLNIMQLLEAVEQEDKKSTNRTQSDAMCEDKECNGIDHGNKYCKFLILYFIKKINKLNA